MLTRAPQCAALVFLLTAALAGACGSDTESEASGGGGAAAAGGGGSMATGCSDPPPISGASCPNVGQCCTYPTNKCVCVNQGTPLNVWQCGMTEMCP
jgi:hypothetical protein